MSFGNVSGITEQAQQSDTHQALRTTEALLATKNSECLGHASGITGQAQQLYSVTVAENGIGHGAGARWTNFRPATYIGNNIILLYYLLFLLSFFFSSFPKDLVPLPILSSILPVETAPHVEDRRIEEPVTPGILLNVLLGGPRSPSCGQITSWEPMSEPLAVRTFAGKLVALLDSPLPERCQTGVLPEASGRSRRPVNAL